jgi:hypothetical protein
MVAAPPQAVAAAAVALADRRFLSQHGRDGMRAGIGSHGGSGSRASRSEAARFTPAPLVALFGLPPDAAEPMALLASILGWHVLALDTQAAGWPAPPAAARLCLAMVPEAMTGSPTPPSLWAWSPDHILNEHISAEGLSILEQPLCIHRLERLLEMAGRAFVPMD